MQQLQGLAEEPPLPGGGKDSAFLDGGTLSVSKVVAKPADLRAPLLPISLRNYGFRSSAHAAEGASPSPGLRRSAPGLHVYSLSCVELLTATSGRTPVARGGSPRVKKSRRDPENSPSTSSLSPREDGKYLRRPPKPLGIPSEALGMELETLGIEFEVLGIEFETLGKEFESLGMELETLGTEFEALCPEFEVLCHEFEALCRELAALWREFEAFSFLPSSVICQLSFDRPRASARPGGHPAGGGDRGRQTESSRNAWHLICEAPRVAPPREAPGFRGGAPLLLKEKHHTLAGEAPWFCREAGCFCGGSRVLRQ